MIQTASDLGYSGIALTDHEALCGHIDFLLAEQELKKQDKIPQDFKCALGNEIYLTDTRESKQKYWHYILIAKNTIGHRALRELSSIAWLNSYRDRGLERVPTLKKELEEIVKKYPNSLISSSSCLGSQLDGLVLQLVDAEAQKNEELIYDLKVKIDSFIRWNLDLFGEDFYIAFAPGRSADQQKFNKRIKSIANAYKIKMVIECDAHYLTAKDRNIHKSFLNSKEGEREVDAFYYDAHLMNDEEAYNNIKNIFSKEEFGEFCKNSQEIYDKIEDYKLFHNPIIPEVKVLPPQCSIRNEYKDFPTIFSLFNSENPQERQWVNDCFDALKEKGKEDQAHLDELEREARIISLISNKLGNCLYSYFNTFKHYIDLFWECGSITGPGRGSSGAFLSNYLLGITQLDPLEWNFPYYRFLNEERVELPDIDVDLSPSKRPQILKEIRKERGELNVAQVATFGTESTKAAIAAACKGYRSEDCPKGIDVDVSQYMSSLIPVERGIVWSIKDCLYGNEEKGRKPVKELKNQFDQYPGLEEIAMGIEGLVCRRGQHASGVMMYNVSPFETTALMKSPNGDITTQFDLSQSELLGDTKFDLENSSNEKFFGRFL